MDKNKLILIAVTVILTLALATKLRQLPLVSKIPTV
jgi:hypothetical protein